MRGIRASSVAQVDPGAFTAQTVAQSRRALAAGERAGELGQFGGYLTDLSLHLSDLRDSRLLKEADLRAEGILQDAELWKADNPDTTGWEGKLGELEGQLNGLVSDDMPRAVRDKLALNMGATMQKVRFNWSMDAIGTERKLYEQTTEDTIQRFVREGTKSKAHDEVDDAGAKLNWSDAHTQRMHRWVDELSDQAVINEAMLRNPALLNEDLKAKNKSGDWKYLRTLDADKRLAATRSSNAEQHRFQTNNYTRMEAQLVSGARIYEDEELVELVENKEITNGQSTDYNRKRNKWQPKIEDITKGYDMVAQLGRMDRTNEADFLRAHKDVYSYITTLPDPYENVLKGKLDNILDPDKSRSRTNLSVGLGILQEKFEAGDIDEDEYLAYSDEIERRYYGEKTPPTRTETKKLLEDMLGETLDADRARALMQGLDSETSGGAAILPAQPWEETRKAQLWEEDPYLRKLNDIIGEGGSFPMHREKAPLPEMEPERWPGVSRYFSREELQSKRSGKEKVDRDMIQKAERMRELFGGPVRITSGYRDYVPKGGAKNSQHLHGRALDINMAGWSHARRAKLLQAALDAGFTGIGFYKDSPNMLHVDTGDKRSWEWGLSDFPAWARNIMASHGYTPDAREH